MPNRWNVPKIFKICIQCNKELIVPPWRKDIKFCNRKCFGDFKKGCIPWNKGVKLPQFSGENSGVWKGGITKDKEYWRKINREYKIKNKEIFNKKRREKYNNDNNYRIKRLAINHKRNTFGELLIKTVQLVYEDNIKKYGTLTCYLCLKPIEFHKDCLEHKVPLSRGGSNEYENLDIAHKSCNCRKNNKTVEEYRILEAKNAV